MIEWAKGKVPQNLLFGPSDSVEREEAMVKALDDVLPGAAKRDDRDAYWSEAKASAEIKKILRAYFNYLEYPGDSSKRSYVDIIDYLNPADIDIEVKEKLDFIFQQLPPSVKRVFSR